MQLPPGPLSGPGQTRNRRRNPLWRFRRFFFVLAILATVALGTGWSFISRVELAEDDFETLIETTYICTAEVQRGQCGPDTAANELALAGEDRVVVTYEQMPVHLINAVVATEDQSFFEHDGVDVSGVMRAGYQTVRRLVSDSGSLQGGSTITQQYVKLTTAEADRPTNRGANLETISAKLVELVQARKLEQELANDPELNLQTKEDVKKHLLTRYLNRAYFGRGAYGVQAASQGYFDKNVEDLSIPEAAYLAGLLRNPNRGDASENLDEGIRRRSETLREMMEQEYITLEEQAAGNADTWPNLIPEQRDGDGIGEVKGSEYGAEYFISAVRSQLDDIYPEGQYFTQSLRVYTTLDPEKQRLAYETITSRLNPADPNMPEGALVSVDANGEVVAMMGGADWNTSQVNLTMGREGGGSGFQPGSLMKVFALAEFIEQGFSAESYFAAPSATTFEAQDGFEEWSVRGGPGGDSNHRTVNHATKWSTNTIYAQIMYEVGPAQVVDIAKRLGIKSELQAFPSLVLGTEEVSPLEMAGAYANLQREGLRFDPVLIERIESADGTVLCWYPTAATGCDPATGDAGPTRTGDQAIDPSVARQVNFALSGTGSGTGEEARILNENGEEIRPIAGKTGTVQDNQYAWYTGFTCGVTTAVWMGYPGEIGQPNKFMNDAKNTEVAEQNGLETPLLPPITELFNDEEGKYLSRGGNGRINGGDIPAEMWSEYMTTATAGDPPCESLPTESAGPNQLVVGQELLTTLVPCAEPDPALVASSIAQEQANNPPQDSNNGTGDGNNGNGNGNGGGDNEDAFAPPPTITGRGVALRTAPFQEQPQPTQGFTPTTDPCIPIDLGGVPIPSTTNPDPQGPSSSDPNGDPNNTDPNNTDPNSTDPNAQTTTTIDSNQTTDTQPTTDTPPPDQSTSQPETDPDNLILDPATGNLIDVTNGNIIDPNTGQIIGNIND